MTARLSSYLYGLFFLILCFATYSGVKAQTKIDSLAYHVDSLFENHSYSAAIPLFLQAIELATDSAHIRRTLADLGYAHSHIKESEKSVAYYLQAAEIAMAMKDSLRSANFIRSAGLNYQRLDLYSISLDKYQEALQRVKGNPALGSMEAQVYNSLGLLYEHLDNPTKGLAVLKEAERIWKNLRDTTNLAKIWTNIAICSDDLAAYDSALYYNRQAFELKKNKNRPSELVTMLNNIGVNLLNLSREDEAYPYLLESFTMHKSINDEEGVAISYKNLADYSLRKNRFRQSEAYLDSVLTIFRSLKSTDYLVDALELQIKLWETTGQFTKGFATYKVWDSLKIELYLEEKFKLQESGNRYLLREKAFENAQIAQRADLLEIKNTQIRYTSILLGITGLLAIAFSVVTSRNLRIQKRQAAYIQHQNTVIKGYQDELRHRTSNNLSRTNSIVNSVARIIADLEVKERLLNASRILATAAAMERHLIGVENEQEVLLGEFVESVIAYQLQAIELEDRNVKIDFSSDEELFLPVDQVIPIAIILNEWITNSLKYAFDPEEKGEITIRIHKEKDSVIIQYRDNGKGIATSSHAGMGSRLNELFLGELKGSLTTASEGGLRHHLSFPLKKSRKKTFSTITMQPYEDSNR